MKGQKLVGRGVVETADFALPYPLYAAAYDYLAVLEGATALFTRVLLKGARVRDRAVGNTRVQGSHPISLC